MTNWVIKARTLIALGLSNVTRVAGYRLGVKCGLNSVRRLQAGVPHGPFFLAIQADRFVDAPAVSAWQTYALLFSHWRIALTEDPPDWLANPLNGQRISGPDRSWWQIPDFDPVVGDIKVIWELSRMDWVLAFSQRASQGDAAALKRLNEWLADWCSHNPPYKGPNWKCGQEASIRVMHPLQWLGVDLPSDIAPATKGYEADDGGFAMLRRGAVMALLHYPRFRFRPSQADALHLDFWLGSENMLRDAGSFSYNTEPDWLSYFGGTASHNTIQFDDRDQMPRLSRFLLGDWLKTTWLQPLKEDAQGTDFGAAYRDGQGSSHRRLITLEDTLLRIEDVVTGFACKAVLRWRLRPLIWQMEGEPGKLRLVSRLDPKQTLTVRSNKSIVRCDMVKGWESVHYMEKTEVSVLEIEVREPCSLVTELRWGNAC